MVSLLVLCTLCVASRVVVDCVGWWLGKEALCDCEKCYRRKKGWEATRMEEIRELVDGGDLGKIPR